MFPLKKSYGDTDFITGMRAVAALAVMLVHSGGAGLRSFGEIGNAFVDLGRAGVMAFFVISGFSVAQSYYSSSGYFGYLNKRLWRVAPLYYFWLLVAIVFSVSAVGWQQHFSVGIDFYNVLMHLSFLSVFDYRVTNTILGVEWSISIEVFWYFWVPLLLLVSNRKILFFLLVLLSAKINFKSVAIAEKLPLPSDDALLAWNWSPWPYLYTFCLGIAAYKLRPHLPKTNFIANFVFLACFALVVAYLVSPELLRRLVRDGFNMIVVVTFFMLVFGTQKSTMFRFFLANRFALFFGVISYGLYLSHVPIISFLSFNYRELAERVELLFFVVLLIGCLISVLTFYLIERPGQQFGQWISESPSFKRLWGR
ncbi:acyltransferase [Pseudomonas sp. ENNP23]|uniref:acyltransferase family protein n=1 Tax=Pseudomonas sp. ENNP23 TaxID=1535636 RepID=UPI0009F517EB|nr:acyltransferase [Pseudomonas sp. ENNP23]